MPPSQLKTLKASLRAEGVLGPRKSRKQKHRNNGLRGGKEASLRHIRDEFNPFEYQVSNRENGKFEATTNRFMGPKAASKLKARPGVTKGLGEENRRNTLLREMSLRKKVGGVVDKRFGENDPTMRPEDKMLERFTKEQQRRSKGRSLFDLEFNDEEENQLTHFGQSLSFDKISVDDFEDEADSRSEAAESFSSSETESRKRKRSPDSPTANYSTGTTETSSDRPKSKAEVMSEVIAKSKSYKYERQKAKEDDEDLRNELDNEMPGLMALMNATKRQAKPLAPASNAKAPIHPDRAALLSASTSTDKHYDGNVKELALDRRSQPTDKTKTEEEQLRDAANRLQSLEKERTQRMHAFNEDDDVQETHPNDKDEGESLNGHDDALEFGFRPTAESKGQESFGVEDEDDFILDEDLVALDSPSDASVSDETASDLSETEAREVTFSSSMSSKQGPTGAAAATEDLPVDSDKRLAFTYPCPETHAQFIAITEDVDDADVFLVVQRIRSLHHPKLDGQNKKQLSVFAVILVEHIKYLSNTRSHLHLEMIQGLIRHIHSMAKMFPEEIGTAFKLHLRQIDSQRPNDLQPGDVMLLTAISTIFPTSDRFHSVVTPAALSITRYLAHSVPIAIHDLTIGAYMVSLILNYQALSKRYVPEAFNYTLNALRILAPVTARNDRGSIFFKPWSESMRLSSNEEVATGSLTLSKVFEIRRPNQVQRASKQALFCLLLKLVEKMAILWSNTTASCEIIEASMDLLKQLASERSASKTHKSLQTHLLATISELEKCLGQARKMRRPLELHHHRPLPIKMSIPKFEETFNPEKHYDPDRERSESNKLKAEYKKERKGALRELRKDANFVARETLREKKERDREYEKKFKRLVAEIQGEEGKEKNQYEREKQFRRGRK